MSSGDKNKILGLRGEVFMILLITLVALGVRLLNIDKPFGLWYDEMLTYAISSHSFPVGILKECWRLDFHMPMYYIYVGLWMKLFGAADLSLRLSSVLWGVLCVPAFFYLGKIYKSKKLGYFLAVIAALSPIMIYYSQEVRFYSMLMFFATISLIYFLRILEIPSRRNFIFWGLANLVILYIYTMGIIFVGLEVLVLFIYLKNSSKTLLKYLAGFGLLSLPYFFLLGSYLHFSNQVFLDPFSYYQPNNFGTLFLLLNDWFSPALSLEGGNIYRQLIQNKILSLLVMTVSTACFVVGIASALRKPDKKVLCLASIAALFLGAEAILSLSGNFVLLSKYTLVIFPIILLIACDGLLSVKNKPLKICLIGIILLTFMLNCLNYKYTMAFSQRRNGFRSAAAELMKLKPDKKDYILFSNSAYLFQKYINNTNFVDFDLAATLYLDKSKKEALSAFDKDFVLTTNKHNALDKFLPYLLSAKPTRELQAFEKSAVERIPNGGRLIIVDSWRNPFFESMQSDILNYKNNKPAKCTQIYRQRIFYFVYSKIYADLKLLIERDKSLKRVQTITVGGENTGNRAWRILIYEKRLHV